MLQNTKIYNKKNFKKYFKKDVDICRYLMYIIEVGCDNNLKNGIIAQLGEHLPYKQGVIGSSPIGPIYDY